MAPRPATPRRWPTHVPDGRRKAPDCALKRERAQPVGNEGKRKDAFIVRLGGENDVLGLYDVNSSRMCSWPVARQPLSLQARAPAPIWVEVHGNGAVDRQPLHRSMETPSMKRPPVFLDHFGSSFQAKPQCLCCVATTHGARQEAPGPAVALYKAVHIGQDAPLFAV